MKLNCVNIYVSIVHGLKIKSEASDDNINESAILMPKKFSSVAITRTIMLMAISAVYDVLKIDFIKY